MPKGSSVETPLYLLRGRRMEESAAEWQQALAELHGSSERPRCLCIPGGVDMYIARMDRYLLKRMPGTGQKHHPSCVSFEPEYSNSGLGELMGGAVVVNDDADTEIYVSFPLKKGCGMAIRPANKMKPLEVSVAKRKMSLRAVMHYLFDRAGFNRWAPAMEGKRTQAVIHKYLMEVAGSTRIKGRPMSEHLYVPEQFNEQRKAEIAERRRGKLASLTSHVDAGTTGIGIILGEFKGVAEAVNGKKVFIKHMPDMPLFIDEKSWKKIERTFEATFLMRDADPEAALRIILCALIYPKNESAFLIHAASLMTTTANWIPVEDAHETQLVHALTSARRRFIKPLAYDSRHAVHFATALLLDAGPTAVPLHTISAFRSDTIKAEKVARLQATPGAWVWLSSQPMPPLPVQLNTSRPAPAPAAT